MVMKIGPRLSRTMFCNEKIVDLYLAIQEGPLSYVSKKVDMNYSHALKLLRIWESFELIELNKAGMRYNIFYTYKGKRIADLLDKVKRALKKANVQW